MLPSLHPFDCLLYDGEGLTSRLIKLKTWSPVSHVEVYVGGGETVTARAAPAGGDTRTGVHRYRLTFHRLRYVLRPVEAGHLQPALAWFDTHAAGQAYDYRGLLRFFTLGQQSLDRQHCGEVSTRFLRHAGLHLFAPDYDADLVSPGMFLSSPALRVVWRA